MISHALRTFAVIALAGASCLLHAASQDKPSATAGTAPRDARFKSIEAGDSLWHLRVQNLIDYLHTIQAK